MEQVVCMTIALGQRGLNMKTISDDEYWELFIIKSNRDEALEMERRNDRLQRQQQEVWDKQRRENWAARKAAGKSTLITDG
jgi:hypothetical protein